MDKGIEIEWKLGLWTVSWGFQTSGFVICWLDPARLYSVSIGYCTLKAIFLGLRCRLV